MLAHIDFLIRRTCGAVSYGSNSVSVIDTATGLVSATITSVPPPFAVAITPDGTKAYVTNFGSDTVSVIRIA